MSMNLHCEGYCLIQTPGWITAACTVDSEGYIYNSLKGDEAKRALYIYLEWVQSRHRNSAITPEQVKEMDEETEYFREQKHELVEYMRIEGDDLKVYVL